MSQFARETFSRISGEHLMMMSFRFAKYLFDGLKKRVSRQYIYSVMRFYKNGKISCKKYDLNCQTDLTSLQRNSNVQIF